jgi:hypothetical protein
MIMISAFFTDHIAKRIQRKSVKYLFLLVSIIVFFVSIPTFAGYYKNNFINKIPFETKEIYQFAGYGDSELFEFIDGMKKQGIPEGSVVYTYRLTQFKYYFQKAGFAIIGDDFRKNAYFKLEQSIEEKKGREFLEGSGAVYLISSKDHIKRFEQVLPEIISESESYILYNIRNGREE